MHLAAREDTWLVSSMPGRPHWILTDMELSSQHNQLPLKGKLGRKFLTITCIHKTLKNEQKT
jgi:hypothetical protein